MSNATPTAREAFANLTPDNILDAVEAKGYRCDGRFLALNSYENRVYQIYLEEDEILVAKFYRPDRWTDQAILEEHEFTVSLANQEIPVIPPKADSAGNTLLYHDPYRFALFPCRGGRPPELDNPQHLQQLGRLIGRMHAIGATHSFSQRNSLNIDNLAVKPSQFLLDKDFIPDYLKTAYQTLTKDLIEQISQCFDRLGSLCTIRLHGDFHPGNILWTDKGPHVVDFDDACMGPSIQDLWMFLSGDRSYMTEGLGDLMEGYCQFYEFNASELHLIEPLRTLRMIHYAGWLAARWNDPAFPLAFPWFNTSNYWDNHILTLREQAAMMNEPVLSWN